MALAHSTALSSEVSSNVCLFSCCYASSATPAAYCPACISSQGLKVTPGQAGVGKKKKKKLVTMEVTVAQRALFTLT